MLIGGRGLLDKLLVPSLHRHIPHIVSDVLRLKQFSYHSHKDPIKKMDNNEKRTERLLCHVQLCECNTERFPWRRAFQLWFPAATPLPSISSSSFFLLLLLLLLPTLYSVFDLCLFLIFLFIGPRPS